jgi:hypothetical protein
VTGGSRSECSFSFSRSLFCCCFPFLLCFFFFFFLLVGCCDQPNISQVRLPNRSAQVSRPTGPRQGLRGGRAYRAPAMGSHGEQPSYSIHTGRAPHCHILSRDLSLDRIEYPRLYKYHLDATISANIFVLALESTLYVLYRNEILIREERQKQPSYSVEHGEKHLQRKQCINIYHTGRSMRRVFLGKGKGKGRISTSVLREETDTKT